MLTLAILSKNFMKSLCTLSLFLQELNEELKNYEVLLKKLPSTEFELMKLEYSQLMEKCHLCVSTTFSYYV